MIPTIEQPLGDPGAVRALAQRLRHTGRDLASSAGGLAVVNQEAVQVWESLAQRVFSTMTEGMSGLVRGASDIVVALADALSRYADILEGSQHEARQARQRLEALLAATPAGLPPDTAELSAILAQGRRATTAASAAAQELARAANGLLGPSGRTAVAPEPKEMSASFVSRVHVATSDEAASPVDRSASFDAQADAVQQQLLASIAAMGALRHPTPPPTATSPVIVPIDVPVSLFAPRERGEGVIMISVKPPIGSGVRSTTPPRRRPTSDAEAQLDEAILDNVILGNIQAQIRNDQLDSWHGQEDDAARIQGFIGRHDLQWRPWPLPTHLA